MLHIEFLGNEIRNAYKPAKPAKKLPQKAVMKPTLAQFIANSENTISKRKTLSTEL